MLNSQEHSIFFDLADILVGNDVDTGAVSRSLELICQEYGFGSGVLYEVDVSKQFCLQEHYSSCSDNLEEQFNILPLSLPEQKQLASQDFYYIRHGDNPSDFESRLMALYNTKGLVLAPVAYQGHIYGLVILSNPSSKYLENLMETRPISAALSMLIHYIEIRIYQKRIKQSQITLGNILDNTGIDIYVNDFHNHDILYINKSMAAPYGGQEMFDGHKCWEVLFPGQSGPCEFCPKTNITDDEGNPTKVHVWDYERSLDGCWFRVFSAAFYWTDGRLAHIVSSADITDNKRNEAIIENLANYDQLTKLPNRRMLLNECKRRIDNATANDQGYLLFFDIDKFKAINDNLGHDAGDEFLIQLGEFFSKIPLLHQSIYRNGGDEFVAIIGGENISKFNIQTLSSFIHQRFQKPWKLKKGDVFCNVSIGVACYPEDGITADALLQKADMAMYKVKKSGGAGLCFGYQMLE